MIAISFSKSVKMCVHKPLQLYRTLAMKKNECAKDNESVNNCACFLRIWKDFKRILLKV